MKVLWLCEKYSVASQLVPVLFDGVASHNPPVILSKKVAAGLLPGLAGTPPVPRRAPIPPLSAGRVQSAVAALVEDRCREIESFSARIYFEVKAVINTPLGPLGLTYHPSPAQRLETRDEAEALASRLGGHTVALWVKTATKATKPVDFLSTSGAQKQAFHLWRWSPERTLELLQKLYDAKLVTYPRTECAYLSAGHAQHMPHLLRRLAALPRDRRAGPEPSGLDRDTGHSHGLL